MSGVHSRAHITRQRATLLPDTLDDYVDEDHPVRVIDAFVDSLSISPWVLARQRPGLRAASPIILAICSNCTSTGISIRPAQLVGWRRNAIATWNYCG